MRGLVSGAALFAMATASVVACTFIVDGQTKDLSATCTPRGATDTACGRCAVTHCQDQINANCSSGGGDLSTLEGCIERPYPGSEWSCKGLLDDAAVHEPGIKSYQAALRTCVASGCMTECTTCTDIDAGSGACGACIMSSCGDLLNGNDGCCENTDVRQGIATCTEAVNPNCNDFRATVASVRDSGTDGSDAAIVFRSCKGFSSSSEEFANCVVTHCDQQCPQ